MRENKKIAFDEPIIVGGKPIEKVTMRVPKGKDLRAVSHVLNPVERDFQMISNLCDINASIDDFDEFGAKEIIQLQTALQGFLLPTVKK